MTERIMKEWLKTDPELLALIERMRGHVMSDAEAKAQRRSWAVGELMLSHPEMTVSEAVQVVEETLRYADQQDTTIVADARRIVGMDDDELRREAILKKHQEVSTGLGNLPVEVRLEPDFCRLVRRLAAGIVVRSTL